VKIEIPEPCLIALVGASGSGKSTFAKAHFKPTEILSSDYFRGLVSDDESDQGATPAAFESLYFIANKRLDGGRLTVIDATNVQVPARKKIIELARAQNVLAVAIVLDVPEKTCIERNHQRPDRNVGLRIIRNHVHDLRNSLRRLQKEGFRYIHILDSPEEIDSVEIVRTKLWNDKKDESGPFDIIGDVHGCYDELCELLEKLRYTVDRSATIATPPDGRRAIFLGDLCDRGPQNAKVLRLAMNMVESGTAFCIPGNHDVKLLKKLRGSETKLSYGLDLTVAELEKESPEFIERAINFIDGLVSHYILDGGRLVVAHAGLSEKLQGRSSGKVRSFCLYGDTTGETDEFGLPVRLNWADEYRGRALVVYGHVPFAEARRLNNTICIDTGCVFGGRLSAFRYPERELLDVPAKKEYYAPARPLDSDAYASGDSPERKAGSGQSGNLACEEPDITDILGNSELPDRRVQTRLHRDIPIGRERAALTLEIMARFSVDPRWLIYLPPTMSPCATSPHDAIPGNPFLEHPNEAFAYYRKKGIAKVVCEEKHMGSRTIIILCCNAEIVKARFGINSGTQGIIYTRTGRHFFDGAEKAHEQAILARLNNALEKSNFWEAFATDWVCLDTELMPWSAKARSLITEQYAPSGMAGRHGLGRAIEALKTAEALNAGTSQIEKQSEPTTAITVSSNTPGDMYISATLHSYINRLECVKRYTEAYRRYCWPVASVDDYRIAPFHVLATEGKVWNNERHLRHLEVVKDYITGSDPVFIPTNHLVVDLNDEASVKAGIDWWLGLTNSGGEGMVVKPLDFVALEKNRLIQPAVKCRGREYLRIIYGPEYTIPASLDRLRKRSLKKKQELALAEFALGMESLERFVKREPFYRVHECAFAVLALENEEVDPRL